MIFDSLKFIGFSLKFYYIKILLNLVIYWSNNSIISRPFHPRIAHLDSFLGHFEGTTPLNAHFGCPLKILETVKSLKTNIKCHLLKKKVAQIEKGDIDVTPEDKRVISRARSIKVTISKSFSRSKNIIHGLIHTKILRKYDFLDQLHEFGNQQQ